jgi:hypothetical protein
MEMASTEAFERTADEHLKAYVDSSEDWAKKLFDALIDDSAMMDNLCMELGLGRSETCQQVLSATFNSRQAGKAILYQISGRVSEQVDSPDNKPRLYQGGQQGGTTGFPRTLYN